MNFQFAQRIRVYVAILIMPVVVAACVSQPAREQSATASVEQPTSPGRPGPTSEVAAVPSPEVSSQQVPRPPPVEQRARAEAGPSSTTDIAASGAQTDTRPAAAPGAASEKAVTAAARREPPKPRETPAPQAANRPGNSVEQAAPSLVPAAIPDAPTAQRTRGAATQRPSAAGAAEAAAQPESSPLVATEVESRPSKRAAIRPDNAEPKLDEEVRLAMIPKPASEIPRKPDIADLTYDDASLPISFAGGWVLDRRRDPLDGAIRCLLLSREFPIHDGYELTKAQIQVSLDAVLVKTDSNIDTSYPEQGLRVDDGALVAFAPQILNERSLYTKRAVQVAMAKGERLTLALGFWPTWPVTRTQQATLDLAGFDIAFAALQACAMQATAG